MKMFKELFEVIKEIEPENETVVIFSGLVQWEEYDFHSQIGSKG